MAGEIASAYVTLIPSFRGGASQIEKELSGPTITAARSNGRLFGKVFAGATTGYIAGNLALGGLSKAFGVAKSGIVDFNSELQQSQIAFTTMLGSGKKARAFLDRLQAFAKATPFEFSGLVQNSQLLLGMGIRAKDLIPTMTALGDSAASVGASQETLNNTMLAFGQIAAKGKLSMDNMNQLLQGGVPTALKVLAAQFHTTTGDMVNMISQGKVASSVALPLLVKGLEKGTKSTAALGGMMDKQSKTYAGAMSNISDSTQQALGKIGKPLFDELSKDAQKLATYLGSPEFNHFATIMRRNIATGLDKAERAASGFVDGMKTGQGVGGAFAHTMKLVWSTTKAAADVTGRIVGIFDSLPGPLKAIAVEGGIAALVFPRISAAVTGTTTSIGLNIAKLQQLRAELTYTETRGAAVSTMMTKLGGAAKAAAGVGGMVALAQGSQTTDRALGGLLSTAGAVATGFSVGGPWGAAIGGGIGLLANLRNITGSADRAAQAQAETLRRQQAFKARQAEIGSLISTLDRLTGATTRATRATLLQNVQSTASGRQAIQSLKSLGFNSKQALDIMTNGNSKASQSFDVLKQKLEKLQQLQLSAPILGDKLGKRQSAQLARLNKLFNNADAVSLLDTLKQVDKQRGVVASTQARWKATQLAVKGYIGTLKGLPKNIRQNIKANGLTGTIADAKKLAAQYKGLNGRTARLILKAEGLKPSQANIAALVKSADAAKPKLTKSGKDSANAFTNFFAGGITKGKGKVDTSLNGLVLGTTRSTSGRSFGSGSTLGVDYGAGYVQGINSKIRDARSAGFNLGVAAKQGTQAGQNSHSPSKVAHKLGGDFGTGYRNGLLASTRSINRAAGRVTHSLISKFHGLGKGAVASFTAGITGNENQASKAVDHMMSAISKAIRSKKNKDGISKAAADAMRHAVNEIAKQAADLRKTLGKRKDLAGQIASTLKGEFDLSNLISPDSANAFGFTAPVTAASVVSGAKGIAARLKAFAGKLRRLAGMGVPPALISEIANLGSTDGSTVADAFLSGSRSQIKDLQTAFNQINKFSQSIGSFVGNDVYGTQIKNQQAQLDAMLGRHEKHNAKDIGHAVAQALRESPLELVVDGKKAGRIYLAGQRNVAEYA